MALQTGQWAPCPPTLAFHARTKIHVARHEMLRLVPRSSSASGPLRDGDCLVPRRNRTGGKEVLSVFGDHAAQLTPCLDERWVA